MYTIKRDSSPKYYAGFVGGLDGGAVWHQKKSKYTKVESSVVDLVIKQLTELGYKVEKELSR